MSLLLNALKKAEEDSSTQKTEQSASGKEGAVGSPSSPQSAGVGAPGAINVKPEVSASSTAASVDFDAIAEKTGGGAAIVGGDSAKTKKHERVDAARVFGASEEEVTGGSSSGFRRLIVAFIVLVGLGGGGYAAVFGGLLPGIDIFALFGFQSEVTVVSQPVRQSPVDQLTTSEGISLLPVPAIDVQAGIDFADLSLLENRPGDFSKEEYRQKIAILTGYDINREIQRRKEEELRLIEELRLSGAKENDAGVDEESTENVGSADEEAVEPEIQTAKFSRLAKLGLDVKTASDNNLNIKFSRKSSGDSLTPNSGDVSEPVASSRVAQIDVQLSLDGQERNNLLQRAQQNYYKGAYADAEFIYRQIIRSSPTNRNALRGLAMIAVATGRYQLAAATYLDILNFYPNDPVAISELTNLRGSNKESFYEVEKVLKNLIGKSPEIDDRVYFSLGNLYSEAGRFNHAQKAYFEALSRRTDNPDYAYNLAVVLDYLNKPSLAVRYYQQALSLSEGVAVFGFNVSEVKSRISQLQLR